jgi:hypothetical protein
MKYVHMGFEIEHLFFAVSNRPPKMDLDVHRRFIPPPFFVVSTPASPTHARQSHPFPPARALPDLLPSPSLLRSEGIHRDGARDGGSGPKNRPTGVATGAPA